MHAMPRSKVRRRRSKVQRRVRCPHRSHALSAPIMTVRVLTMITTAMQVRKDKGIDI